MGMLNVNFQVLAYLDAQKTANPLIRVPDMKFQMMGVPTGVPKFLPIYLAPGESQTLLNMSRALSFNGSTSFSITKVSGTDYARLNGAFGARTARAAGDGTTQWALTVTNGLVRLQYTGTGTAPTFGGMQAGDGLTIEKTSGFNALNQGDFTITKVGADYVEFKNAFATGETVTSAVSIYSSGPVQVGDVLDLSSTAFSYVNRGQFKILRLTADYVEFSNPSAVAEASITGVGATDLVIYNISYKWMSILTDQRLIVRLNGDTSSSVEVEPPTPGDLAGNPGFYAKRGKVYSVTLYNPGLDSATGIIFLAE
jgi:hypothetical protein